MFKRSFGCSNCRNWIQTYPSLSLSSLSQGEFPFLAPCNSCCSCCSQLFHFTIFFANQNCQDIIFVVENAGKDTGQTNGPSFHARFSIFVAKFLFTCVPLPSTVSQYRLSFYLSGSSMSILVLARQCYGEGLSGGVQDLTAETEHCHRRQRNYACHTMDS